MNRRGLWIQPASSTMLLRIHMAWHCFQHLCDQRPWTIRLLIHCVHVKLCKYFKHRKLEDSLRVEDWTSSDSLHHNMVRMTSWSDRLPCFGSPDSTGISSSVCVWLSTCEIVVLLSMAFRFARLPCTGLPDLPGFPCHAWVQHVHHHRPIPTSTPWPDLWSYQNSHKHHHQLVHTHAIPYNDINPTNLLTHKTFTGFAVWISTRLFCIAVDATQRRDRLHAF